MSDTDAQQEALVSQTADVNFGSASTAATSQKLDGLVFALISLNCKVHTLSREIKEAKSKYSNVAAKLEANQRYYKGRMFKLLSELKDINPVFAESIVLEADYKFQDLEEVPFPEVASGAHDIEILGYSYQVPSNETTGTRMLTREGCTVADAADKPLMTNLNINMNQTKQIGEVIPILKDLQSLTMDEAQNDLPPDVLKTFYSNVCSSFEFYPKTHWAEVIELLFCSLPKERYHTKYDFRFSMLEIFYSKTLKNTPALGAELLKTRLVPELKDWLIDEISLLNIKNQRTILYFIINVPELSIDKFELRGILESLRNSKDRLVLQYAKYILTRPSHKSLSTPSPKVTNSASESTQSPITSKEQSVIGNLILKITQDTPIDELLYVLNIIKKKTFDQIQSETEVESLREFYKQATRTFKISTQDIWVELINALFTSFPRSSYHTTFDFRFDILHIFYDEVFSAKPNLPCVFKTTIIAKEIANWLKEELIRKQTTNVYILLKFLCHFQTQELSDFGIDQVLMNIKKSSIDNQTTALVETLLKREDHQLFNLPSNQNIQLKKNSLSPTLSKEAPSVIPSQTLASPGSQQRPNDDALSRRSDIQSDKLKTAANPLSRTPVNESSSRSSDDSPPVSEEATPKLLQAHPEASASGPPVSGSKTLAFASYLASMKAKSAPTNQGTKRYSPERQNAAVHSPKVVGPLKSILKDKDSKSVSKKKSVSFYPDSQLVSYHFIESNIHKGQKSTRELNKEEGQSLHNRETGDEVVETGGEQSWRAPEPINFDDIFTQSQRSDIAVSRGGLIPINRRFDLDKQLLDVLKGNSVGPMFSPLERLHGLVTPDEYFNGSSDYENLEPISQHSRVEFPKPEVSQLADSNQNPNQRILDLLHGDLKLKTDHNTNSEIPTINTIGAVGKSPLFFENRIPSQIQHLPLQVSPQAVQILNQTTPGSLPENSSGLKRTTGTSEVDSFVKRQRFDIEFSWGNKSPSQGILPVPQHHSGTLPRQQSSGDTHQNDGFPLNGVSRSSTLPPLQQSSFEQQKLVSQHHIPGYGPYHGDELVRMRQLDVRPQVVNQAWTKSHLYLIRCKYYAVGTCSRGDRCHFIHIR